MVCESDEPKEDAEGADSEEPKKGHGGCGAAQPLIRKEGLKLFVQYKRGKDEDEVCDITLHHLTLLIPNRMSSLCNLTSDCSLLRRCMLL